MPIVALKPLILGACEDVQLHTSHTLHRRRQIVAWLLPERSGQGLCGVGCSFLQISVTHATTSPIGISKSAQPGPGSTTGGASIGGAFVGIGPRSAAYAAVEKPSNNASGMARKRMRTPLVKPKKSYINQPKDASPICSPLLTENISLFSDLANGPRPR
jgi:hypothetical protein